MKPILFVLSKIYGAVVSLRNQLYDRNWFKSYTSPIPVVAVGNLTSGGAGKTPFVDWIVKYYEHKEKRVAMISRGYKRKSKGVILVCDGQTVRVSSDEAGDEALMLARRNPNAIVVVAEKRADAVRFILEEFKSSLPDVIVLDDGFQHRALNRDLNLLVIHAEKNPFTDSLLPLGTLRESTNGIKRADMVLYSKITKYIDLKPIEQSLRSFQKPSVKSRVKIIGLRSFHTGEILPIGEPPFLAARAFAFSGIGDPKNFMEKLEYAGLIVEHQKHFSDHHDFTAADIEFITSEVIRHGINIVVTTEKDFYRLKANDVLFNELKQTACFYLEIEFEIFEGEDLFEERLLNVLK